MEGDADEGGPEMDRLASLRLKANGTTDRVKEDVVVVATGFPHREAEELLRLDELALGSEGAGVIKRHHHVCGFVIYIGL